MGYRPNVTDKEQSDLERAEDDSAIRIHWFNGNFSQEGQTKSIPAYDLQNQNTGTDSSNNNIKLLSNIGVVGGIIGSHNDNAGRFLSDSVGRA